MSKGIKYKPPKPARAEKSTVKPEQSPVEAFRTLASSCVRHWLANAGAAAESNDPEFIHQLRVSQRRLRSLIRLFRPVLPEAFTAEWSERLRQNANSFGDARDLDVLCDEIIAPVARALPGADSAMARLLTTACEELEGARAKARERLDPVAQGRLLIEFTTALHALPANSPAGAGDLRTFTRRQLTRLRKRARKRFKSARGFMPGELHALRIALKHLRYAAEFFAPLMRPKEVARYLKSLARAQDALGYIHDVNVAGTMLTKWAGDDVEMRVAAAFVSGWHGPRHAHLCRRSIRELKRLLYADSPWRY